MGVALSKSNPQILIDLLLKSGQSTSQGGGNTPKPGSVSYARRLSDSVAAALPSTNSTSMASIGACQLTTARAIAISFPRASLSSPKSSIILQRIGMLSSES